MPTHPLPIIAIVGRPNVGKSTLFNRYTGRRRALVQDEPGITRDRIMEEAEVGTRRVWVVDTAGLDADAASGLDMAVQDQAQAALQAADAILFVVDGRAGLLPQEQAIAQILRRSQKPLLVAVNKIDGPKQADRVLEFHALGLEPVRAVSGEHGTGAWDALEELVAALPDPPAEESPVADPEGAMRVALVGRPNVGKSSLLNRLLGSERVVVSDVPGTTRDSIDIRLERDGDVFVFVDTAGLRRQGRRDRLAERGSALMTLRAIERADVALVLMDAGEGFTDQDLRLLSMVRQEGCAAALVVNKWDLAEGDPDLRERLAKELDRRLSDWSDMPQVRISAKTGKGTGRLLPQVRKLHSATSLAVPTPELNRWLQETVAKHEPSMAQSGPRKRPIKFFYATQTGTRPPTFMLFCTEPRAVKTHYRRFLENQLRARFDLRGVPVRLRLRARSKRDSE